MYTYKYISVHVYMYNHVHSALQSIEKKKENKERNKKVLRTHTCTHNSLNGLEKLIQEPLGLEK